MSRDDESFTNNVRAALDERRTVNAWPLLVLLVSMLGLAGVWAHSAVLDEVTVSQGRVIPSTQLQVVQSLEGGLVAELFVSEGDIVEAGEPLIRIDDTDFSATLGELRQRFEAMSLQRDRLRAEAFGKDLTYTSGLEGTASAQGERALFEARKSSLDRELAVIDQQLAQRRIDKTELETRLAAGQQSLLFLNEELSRARDLSAAGAYPRMDLLRLEREATKQNLDQAILEASIPKAQAAIDEAIAQRDATILGFRAEAHEALTGVLGDLSVLSESITSAEDKVRRTILRAPVEGVINSLSVATIGAVIPPGESLAELVPLNDTLLIEAQIRPQDVAFLYPGQSARVRVTAYDYTIYGDLAGQVERISADTMTDQEGNTFYRAIIRTDQNHLNDEADSLPILPGMIVSASILTGQKTVLDYLFKPILKAKSEALRER